MMQNGVVTLAQGDSGRPFPIQHVLTDGTSFSPNELSVATIVNRIYHYEHLKVEMTASNQNVQIDIRPERMYLYSIGDKIMVDSEEMDITAVDLANNFVTVTRANPFFHRRGTAFRHVVSELNTSVVWSGSAGSLVWTPDIAETGKIGTFYFELQITSGVKIATALGSSMNNPYVLHILRHGGV